MVNPSANAPPWEALPLELSDAAIASCFIKFSFQDWPTYFGAIDLLYSL
jgi:hypothetical protein